MTYGTTHRIQRPTSAQTNRKINEFKLRFNTIEQSWQVWTFLNSNTREYRWLLISKADMEFWRDEFNAPIIEFIPATIPVISTRDYLWSALEGEIIINANDSPTLRALKLTLKVEIENYINAPISTRAEDSIRMEAIDQIVLEVREQRMNDGLTNSTGS
jgi:hypothetical protein